MRLRTLNCRDLVVLCTLLSACVLSASALAQERSTSAETVSEQTAATPAAAQPRVVDEEVAELINQLDELGEFAEKTGSELRKGYGRSSKRISLLAAGLAQYRERFSSIVSILDAHKKVDEELQRAQGRIAALKANRNAENDPESLTAIVDGVVATGNATQALLDDAKTDLETAETSRSTVKAKLEAPESEFSAPEGQ